VKFKNVNTLFTPIIYYKLRKVPSYETWCYYNAPFCKCKHLQGGDSNGSKSSYGTVLHSHTAMPYSYNWVSGPCVCGLSCEVH
jgi:hypothetical protein